MAFVSVEMKSRPEIVALGDSIYGTLIPLGKFPLPRAETLAWRDSLATWLQTNAVAANRRVVLWLQTASLQSSGLANALADHGAAWEPALGLGVRPGGEPPRMLQNSDLESLAWNESPTLKHESVVLLEKAATDEALPLYSGSGSLMICVTDSIETYLQQQRNRWLRDIQDRSFRAHPFYVPLIDDRTMRILTFSDLSVALSTVYVYLRESPEDGGTIVLTRGLEILHSLLEIVEARDSNATAEH